MKLRLIILIIITGIIFGVGGLLNASAEADTVENVSEYIYTPDTSEEKYPPLYFQVRQTVGDEVFLSNSQEVYYYIDREDKLDTDRDGLSDYEEIKIYGTDPLERDTDGDGIPDLTEYKIMMKDD